ncbi:hypothetical protein LTR85_009043 [Meristemomyces frigidus]|nr:hypothetical protein LTR85_009043 [Meristemomyces frigidus]
MAKLQKLRKSRSASSIATVIITRPKKTSKSATTKPRNKYSVTREASAVLPTSTSLESKSKMCKPVDCPVEDWTKPKPREMELLVDADSAVAKNLENPKVRYLMGITKVSRLEMAPAGTSVMMAKISKVTTYDTRKPAPPSFPSSGYNALFANELTTHWGKRPAAKPASDSTDPSLFKET